MSKKQIHVLAMDDSNDFLLVGIICAYRDYRTCYEVNKILEIELARLDDIELKMEKQGSTSFFSVFGYSNIDNAHYFLIANKGNNGFFNAEFKQYDYFIKIDNHSRYTQIEKIVKQLNEVRIIANAKLLDPNASKSFENFQLIEAQTINH